MERVITVNSPEVQRMAAARWEREQCHRAILDRLLFRPVPWERVRGPVRLKYLGEAAEEFRIIRRIIQADGGKA